MEVVATLEVGKHWEVLGNSPAAYVDVNDSSADT